LRKVISFEEEEGEEEEEIDTGCRSECHAI
jgi:hypothetical protein